MTSAYDFQKPVTNNGASLDYTHPNDQGMSLFGSNHFQFLVVALRHLLFGLHKVRWSKVCEPDVLGSPLTLSLEN